MMQDKTKGQGQAGVRGSLQEAMSARPIWQSEQGAIFGDFVKVHSLSAAGRRVVTAIPGQPGAPQPPELTPGQNPAGLTPQRLMILVALAVAFVLLTGYLGLAWWAQLLLALPLLLLYLAWPAVQQLQALTRWARAEEAVTVLLSGDNPNPQEGVIVRNVYPSDSAATLAEGGRSVALVVHGLPAEERVKLVRQVMAYTAMGQVRR